MGPSPNALPSAPPAAHRKRILVVEDELLIRILVSDGLRDAGYDVIEAVNGDEALAVLHTGVAVDLIVSDVRMPGAIDGMGLLAIVTKTFPAVPVIITSGHMDPSLAKAGGACRFVAKPYVLNAIASAVRDALEQRA